MIDELEDNWLEAQTFECANCMNELYRVNHSPFCDSDFFYCDSCAKRVEVSFYDDVRRQILSKFGDNIEDQYQNIQEVENRLRPCACGGNFKYNAPRRCVYCAVIVIDDGAGVDLFPSYEGIDKGKEPTVEDEQNFEKEFMRTENIWK